jgi:hypothetical protein
MKTINYLSNKLVHFAIKTINYLSNKLVHFAWTVVFTFFKVTSDKRMAVALALLFANVSLVLAQSDETGMIAPLWQKITIVYQLMSVLVLLALLFFGGKSAMEGMKGEQGAWVKFGSILAVAGIWFFAIPPFIKYLRQQGNNNGSGFGS